jgi:hypothetical protein
MSYGGGEPTPLFLLIAVFTFTYLLWTVASLTFIRAIGVAVWRLDQFDAETRAGVVRQRIGMILNWQAHRRLLNDQRTGLQWNSAIFI